jgi:hypothetical protein
MVDQRSSNPEASVSVAMFFVIPAEKILAE